MGLEDAREDNLDMASQEEAVAVAAPGEEDVKKMESRGGFLVNGARQSSFNSGFTTDVFAGDIDMAQSQVAVAGSVDSAAEAAVSAGAEPSADVDTGPASSSDVVDSTEKVESWDLSEAVEESAGNKEESKPNFAEDGTLEYIKTQASSDLIADAPTSAAFVQDSAGGVDAVTSAEIEEKAVDLSSEDPVSEEFPVEVSASEGVSPKFQDEGSAEKGGSETSETPLEEVHEATEARTSAEADNEGAGVEAVLSPTADIEEKSDDVEDKLVDVEDEPADVQDKSVDVVDRSVERNSEDAGTVSEELPAEVAASEEVSPKTPDEESAETGDSEAPGAPAEEVREIGEAAPSAEPDEDVAILEASPSPFVDVEEKPFELGSEVARALTVDASPNIEDEGSAAEKGKSEGSAPAEEVIEVAEPLTIAEPLEAAPSPFVDFAEKSFELDPEAGAGSEDVSPETEDEESAETGDSDAPEASGEEVEEVAEAATSAEPLDASPSPFVDVEEKSFELGSDVTRALTVDASPDTEAEGSAAENGESEASAPAEEVNEVAELLIVVEPLEVAPSPFADVEEDLFELDPEVAGAVSEDVSPETEEEGLVETGGSDGAAVPADEVDEVAEAATSAEPDEDVAILEASPSPFVDVEEKPFELGSDVARALTVDASPDIEAEVSAAERDESEASAPAEEVNEVAELLTVAEPLEAAPSPFVDMEVESFELDPEVAGAVSEDVSPDIGDEESAENGDIAVPDEEVHEVTEAPSNAVPDEDVATLEAAPSPADVGEESVELDSEDALTADEDVKPEFKDEGSADKGESEAPVVPVEEGNEVADAAAHVEPDETVASHEAVASSSDEFAEEIVVVDDKSVDRADNVVGVEDKSVEVSPGDVGAVSEELPVEVAGSEELSATIPDEESAETGDSEVPEAPADDVREVAEAATSAEPDEDVATLEASPSPFVDDEEKPFELGSDVARSLTVDASPDIEAEGSAAEGDESEASAPAEEVIEVAEPLTIAEPLEAAPSPFVDFAEKSFELDPEAGAGSEDVSPETEDEESAETGDSDAPEASGEEVEEIVEAVTSAEADEDVATLDASPSPFVDVEEQPLELGFDVARALSVDASPDTEADGSAAENSESNAPAPAEEVNEVAGLLTVEPLEAAPSPFVDVEEKSFELDPEVAGAGSEVSPETKEELLTKKGDSEASEASAVEVEEIAEAATSAEPDEDVTSREATPSSSVDAGEESVGVEIESPITSEEDREASANFDSVPASAADVKDDSIQEVDSNGASEAREVPPSKSVDEEDGSPEPLAEGAADVVGSETRYVPDEDVHEVVEAMITVEPDDGPESALAPSDVAEEKSVDLSSEDVFGVTTASESFHEEDVSPEPSIEATTSAGVDASLESGDFGGSGSLQSLIDEGSAILESMPSPATDVQDDPADGSAEKVESESLFTPVEEVHEVVESAITAESDDGSMIFESEPAPNDGEEPSKETTAELLSENIHDLPVEEVPAPIEETEKTADAATDAEPAVLESSAPSSEDVQATSESVSRESNFEDLKDAPPSSNDTTSGKVATAIGEEEGSSVDVVASDTIPSETSTPPPAVENTKAEKSYDLHEVAVHLEDAAEKTLEEVKSSAVGDGKASYSETVAHIVLDESSKTDDSSELISGVIQHVAQLAQDDFQSDPNVLPDTVNQVFSREAAGSRANDASQPEENTSLGTKFSLFVIWCISLCASHVSSKSMPAPALKLGAEEVAAVLHSDAQGAASSQAASSV